MEANKQECKDCAVQQGTHVPMGTVVKQIQEPQKFTGDSEMRRAFEIEYGQDWTDPDWRKEVGAWASAWHKATAAARELAAVQQGVQQIKANCYSNDDGDYWRDCPDDCDFVEGLKVGDTFELQASVRSWSETFRVTRAPDETSDDYEVELVSSDAPLATHPTQQGLDSQRWQIVHNRISGEYIAGRAHFVVQLPPVPDTNIMRGSVAEHFTKAVDFAVAQAKKGDV